MWVMVFTLCDGPFSSMRFQFYVILQKSDQNLLPIWQTQNSIIHANILPLEGDARVGQEKNKIVAFLEARKVIRKAT
jgi:hypothetical protein